MLATKSLELLLPRDRDLVRWDSEGMAPSEQARRLGLTPDAAGRARRRAVERFRKAYLLVSGAA